jgi:hypothetical protein
MKILKKGVHKSSKGKDKLGKNYFKKLVLDHVHVSDPELQTLIFSY